MSRRFYPDSSVGDLSVYPQASIYNRRGAIQEFDISQCLPKDYEEAALMRYLNR
ncbi:hypothetical protein [Kushneria phyllosphaerae]|uniref:hypothetical protein n=1 Tax=Kushneria phyllosphaerae TaxID=2100822 RepID=UPI001402BC77|nr:hypothetical protein [Kushneria phyllosphaerae]